MEAESPAQTRQTTRLDYSNANYLRLFSIGAVLVWLLVWELTIRFELLNRILFPPPSAIVLRVYRSLIVTGELRAHSWATVSRLLIGLAIGGLPALGLGFLLGRSKAASLRYSLLFAGLGLIPVLAGLPFFVFMFGVEELNKWVVVSAAVFYPILYCTRNGVRNARVLAQGDSPAARNTEPWQWQHGAGPWIFTGLKLGMLLGLATLLGAEMYVANTGLEIEIIRAAAVFELDRAYGGIFATALIAYALWGCLTAAEYMFCRKNGSSVRQDSPAGSAGRL